MAIVNSRLVESTQFIKQRDGVEVALGIDWVVLNTLNGERKCLLQHFRDLFSRHRIGDLFKYLICCIEQIGMAIAEIIRGEHVAVVEIVALLEGERGVAIHKALQQFGVVVLVVGIGGVLINLLEVGHHLLVIGEQRRLSDSTAHAYRHNDNQQHKATQGCFLVFHIHYLLYVKSMG